MNPEQMIEKIKLLVEEKILFLKELGLNNPVLLDEYVALSKVLKSLDYKEAPMIYA